MCPGVDYVFLLLFFQTPGAWLHTDILRVVVSEVHEK